MARGRVVPEVKGVVVAGQLRGSGTADSSGPTGVGASWGLDSLAGRLVEVSGSGPTASLTMATRVMLEAQRRGEPVAWVTAQRSIFFPPDLAASGLDLAALPVVQVEQAFEVAKAAETLLRSGGFALVVLDLGSQKSMTLAVQTRLAGLARRHHAAVLALTRKRRDRSSLGSLVSVRADCTRRRVGFRQFDCELQVIKDKRGERGQPHTERCQGPDGLC